MRKLKLEDGKGNLKVNEVTVRDDNQKLLNNVNEDLKVKVNGSNTAGG